MTEEATAGVGHNNQPAELTDDQRRALFFHHLGRAKNKKAEMESKKGELQNVYKVAKAEGFSKKDIDFAIRLQKGDDEDIVQERRRQQEIAIWLQHPVGVQLSLLDEPERTPLTERAAEQGFQAGASGESCEAPFDSHEPRQAWIAGWHKGQDTIKAVWLARQTPVEEAAAAGGNDRDDDQDEAEVDPDDVPFDDGETPEFVTTTHAERAGKRDFPDPPAYLERNPDNTFKHAAAPAEAEPVE